MNVSETGRGRSGKARGVLLRRLLAIYLVFGFTAAGFAASRLIAPPPGRDHSCPPGSPPADCRYPADQATWSVWWTIGGLALGLVVAAVANGMIRRRAR